jgi:hypothetical protein
MSIRPATRERIEAALRFNATYRGYLANHLPMALVALDRMGADDARIEEFARGYSQHLEPFAASPLVDEFSRRVEKAGIEAALAQSLDALAPGIASAAFHGAIRTAYALESGSGREMAHALAYWKGSFEPLGDPPEPRGGESPAQVLMAISRDPELAGNRPAGVNIAMRTIAAAAMPATGDYASRLDPAQLQLAPMAAALARCYAASGNFTILHGVTGCHAFRSLAAHFRDSHRALRHFWHALVAAYIGCGSPPVEGWGVPGSDALDWPRILERATGCDDEHDVKFAYSCFREGAHYADDLYRRVASARVCHALRETVTC